MIWWIILIVIIVPLIFVGVVKRAEATFPCENCGHSITIRHYARKQITCKWCGKAFYTLYAWGDKVQRVEFYVQAEENSPSRSGIVSNVTRGVDVTEVEDE
jgi:transcription elongation factor Elf1